MDGRELIHYLVAEFVSADSGDSTSVESELRDMISEVCGRATEFASFREAVKERLTYTNYVFHRIYNLQYTIIFSFSGMNSAWDH